MADDCTMCATHYDNDGGPCDEGKPVASPHRKPVDGVVGVSHLFTEARLGAAPFKIIAHEPPWSALGGCDYCGTGIKEKFYLESADGRRFKVGNECIKRAGGAGLFSIAQKMHREAQRELRRERAERQRKEVVALLESTPELCAKLATEQHPYEWRRAKGESLLDYVRYITRNWASQNNVREARRLLKSHGVEL